MKGCSTNKAADSSAEDAPSLPGEMGGLKVVNGAEYFGDTPVHNPPLVTVAFALDPRDPSTVVASMPAQAHTWNPVALSSQLRSLYEMSNDGATIRKTERDSYVDSLRTNTPLTGGVHRFRVRIDNTAGEDFCNHIGFVADGYKGSALNSADSCCIEVDSGRILLDGSACSRITGSPGQGDVVVLQLDLDNGNFSCGVEGQPMTSVYWLSQKRPVYLALSFRRIGWKATLLSNTRCGVDDHMSCKEQLARELALVREGLTEVDPGITLFQAMLEVMRASDAARDQLLPTAERHTGRGEERKEAAHQAPSGVVAPARTGLAPAAGFHAAVQGHGRHPYRLVCESRIDGIRECLSFLSTSAACGSGRRAEFPPERRRVTTAQVWLEERSLRWDATKDCMGKVPVNVFGDKRAASGGGRTANDVLEEQLSAAGVSAFCKSKLVCESKLVCVMLAKSLLFHETM